MTPFRYVSANMYSLAGLFLTVPAGRVYERLASSHAAVARMSRQDRCQAHFRYARMHARVSRRRFPDTRNIHICP